MTVPLLDLQAQNLPLEPELNAAFQRVLRSGQFILGPEVQALEKQIAHMLGVKHAVGVSSGTDAILLALMVLGIGPGDEVVCPSFTFFATAGCIARVGATPVFVDSCPACFNIDPEKLAQRITSRTKAVIPVHLFGQAAAMDAIMALAAAHNLFVIEDAAQALGATYRGKNVGTFGDFGAFSFFPSKNLGGFGDAGLLVTDRDDLAEKARVMRVHGAKPKYYHKFLGGNFRLDPLQAALLAVKLPHYQTYTARRQGNARYYTAALSELWELPRPAARSCGAALDQDLQSEIVLPATHPEAGHIWNQYTLQFQGTGNRDAIRKRLSDRGIGTEIYYPWPLHQQECFTSFQKGELPIASRLTQQVLSIPIYPELSKPQLDEVVDSLREAWAHPRK